MESIDRLTLELLTNKTHYNKYLSQTNSTKFREHQEYLKKVKKYRNQILQITNQYLKNPENLFNLELDEMFSNYSKTFIKYLEMKEFENENRDGFKPYYDEDMMFGNMDSSVRDVVDLDEECSENDLSNSDRSDIAVDNDENALTESLDEEKESPKYDTETTSEAVMSSFWGAERVVKKKSGVLPKIKLDNKVNIPRYTMNMYMKQK